MQRTSAPILMLEALKASSPNTNAKHLTQVSIPANKNYCQASKCFASRCIRAEMAHETRQVRIHCNNPPQNNTQLSALILPHSLAPPSCPEAL
eukprot:460784-Pelagomonas_calceolata.AAC.7